MDGGEYLILSNVLWCPSIHSQATRKLLWSWWTKPGLSTLGWKRSILPRQSEARLENQKTLPLGITHAIAALRWAVDSHHSSHEPVETWGQLRRCHTVKCNVLCCFTILKLCSVTTQLLRAGAEVLLFSQISPHVSLAWRQLTAVRSCYEVELQRPPRPSSPLTEASARLFLLDLLSILPLWGLSTY